jgi:hypothetical protein
LECATLKRALNLLLQKANLNYEVVNDAIVIIPAGLVRPGVDCFTDLERKSNPGEPLDLSFNGLKRLGVDLASASSDRPHLPRSAAAFAAPKTVDYPMDLIEIDYCLTWFANGSFQTASAPKAPTRLLSAFLPRTHYLD